MIEVLTKIPPYCYSSVFPLLQINFDMPQLKMQLINNRTNAEIITEHYDRPPVGQSLEIQLDELLRMDLNTNAPDFSKKVSSHTDVLKEYKIVFSADGSPSVTTAPFKVLLGFAHKQQIVDPQLYMHTNVLSVRPARSYIYDFEPVCLSFLPSAAERVFVDVFFVDGTTTTLDYAPLVAQVVQSVDVSYGAIQRLVAKAIVSYKVYAKKAGLAVTNKIELVLLPYTMLRESYVYANRLGGWDSISFTGEQIEVNSVNPFVANFRDSMLQYDTDIARIKQKNTGYIYSAEHHLQIIDFFRSPLKYVSENGVLKPIVIRQLEPEYSKSQLNSFVFEYSYADKLDRHIPLDFAKPFITIS